jgi:adenine-specific DNA-methyltransferase
MAKKTKLELTWIGKEERRRLEPRILLEDPALYHHAARHVTERDQFNNRIIQGDNLLALKALEAEFTGKVKCIYIDPPYNTGSAFAHYEDGLEHSLWLTMMRDRLELLRRLLAEDGSIWISVDDNEAHYLKILCDEIFGRMNFVANVIWQKRTSPESRLFLGAAHDHILVFAKQLNKLRLNKLSLSSTQAAQFKNPDGDSRGPWVSTDFTAQGYRPNQMYQITTPTGVVYSPPENRCWGNIEPEFKRLLAEGRIWFGKDGNARPRVKTFLEEVEGVSAWTWWSNNEVGHNQEAKKEIYELFGKSNVFETPKPERLLKRVIELGTQPGDLVLDSFAGSGTTGAVAHKMGRRFIIIELGEHVHTHILPRLRKVVDGEDPGGITSAVNWHGGGGFRFFRLAPSLLIQDKYGNYVINRDYNAEMLAEAMCKHESFTYAPSETVYWQHGRSSETDFIYVTTQSLTRGQLIALSEDVGPDRTLLVCAFAFRARDGEFPNLTFKKIPNAVLHRCEWGRDDYSLQISQLPPPDEPAAESDAFAEPAPANGKSRRKRRGGPAAATLFADEGGGEGNNVSKA